LTARSDKVRRGLAALAALRELVRRVPLAGVNLWHNPTPMTSQRVAVQQALAPDLLVFLLKGGNRSGKTEAGAMLCVAWALGRDHPAVQLWATRNGLDVSAIQPGPGVVCASAKRSEDSVNVMRPKCEKFLPEGTTWLNRDGRGPAVARLPGGGIILFKSDQQGREAFQGADWNFLWMDEEHSEPVFNEGRMRCADRAGRVLMTMTPLKGRTWVWKRFENKPEAYSGVYALNSTHNPYMPQHVLQALLAQYGAHERAARERGEFTSLEGRVYSDFQRHSHVVPSFPIPLGWKRYQGWDFGYRNPQAILWVAVDPHDDVVHVYRERYQSNVLLADHVLAVQQIESCPSCHGHPVRGLVGPYPDDGWERLESADYHREREVKAYGTSGTMTVMLPCEADDDGAEWLVQVACETCQAHPGRTEPSIRSRWADPARPDLIRQAQAAGLALSRARNDVRAGINAVAARLAIKKGQHDLSSKPHLVVHDCCVELINEFEGYIWDTTTSKGDQPEQPLKANDHAMDALRYILYMLDRQRGAGASS